MSGTWTKAENKDGFPYYFNETINERSWDHPKFTEIRQRLDDCNYVKYSMYRLALKFRVLQKELFMDDISLFTVIGIFERHRLGASESSLCLENCDLEAILSDIYFASNKKNQTNVDIDLATDLMINLLYNIFDKGREGKLQVSSAKIALYLLSNCSLYELYKSLFSLNADHNNCISRLRLQTLLLKLVEVTTFLHEESSYGMVIVNRTIEDCFFKSPGLAGISESAFISWLESTPKMFSWIPLLHRIKLAEPVVHPIKCTTCKTYPLMGLRYKCTKCLWYTQCQRCFFTGRTSHNHKLSHSMREYCTQSTDNNHAFIKKLSGLVRCSQMVNSSTIVETQPLFEQKLPINSQCKEILCNIEPLSSPQSQIQSIIRQLEVQNHGLELLLRGSCNNKEITTYLKEHRLLITVQIDKLKLLKDSLLKNSIKTEKEPQKISQKTILESTPLVQTNLKPNRNRSIDLLSPINSISEVQTNSENPFSSKCDIQYGVDDMSTWIGGRLNLSDEKNKTDSQVSVRKSPIREFHNDLDEALAKLQQILANNFSLDESLCHIDNANLKYAVSEVEGMLTSIIDSVEHSRGSSVQSQLANND